MIKNLHHLLFVRVFIDMQGTNPAHVNNIIKNKFLWKQQMVTR